MRAPWLRALATHARTHTQVARSLQKLLDWAGPGSVEDVFCLTFEAISDIYGEAVRARAPGHRRAATCIL